MDQEQIEAAMRQESARELSDLVARYVDNPAIPSWVELANRRFDDTVANIRAQAGIKDGEPNPDWVLDMARRLCLA